MGTKDLLVISAHAADYCTRAGGTIAKYVQDGWKATILVMTCGAEGESGSYWKNNPGGALEECEEIRHRESRAAADVLGAEIEVHGFRDYPLTGR